MNPSRNSRFKERTLGIGTNPCLWFIHGANESYGPQNDIGMPAKNIRDDRNTGNWWLRGFTI